jgi:hypothetical protein
VRNVKRIRLTRDLVAAGVSAAAFVVCFFAVTVTSLAAATKLGEVVVVDPQSGNSLRAGGSQTLFALRSPTGASCTGSSSQNGYFVTGYVTAEAIDPASLSFDFDGPHSASASDATHNLIDANGSPYIELNTAPADESGQGALRATGALTWRYFDAKDLAPGEYHLGLACTHSPGDGTTRLDRFWDTAVRFVADRGDPSGFAWSVSTAAKSSPHSNGSRWTALAVLAGVGVAAITIVRHSRRARRKAMVGI